MKGTDQFKEVIQQHLNQVAQNDPLFAKTLAKENKNIDDCITYILNTVKKSGRNGFTDDEVFGMAIHYYDEDDVKPGPKVSGQVVVNHASAPSTPAPAPTSEQAPMRVVKPAKKKAAQVDTGQTSLF